MPLYVAPISLVSCAIFSTVDSSTNVDGSFFSVASTTPFAARMPTSGRARALWRAAAIGCSRASHGTTRRTSPAWTIT